MSEVNKVYLGDCIRVMSDFPDSFIDAIITDPTYNLPTKINSMKWDSYLPGVEYWESALRVCKPGANLMAFGHPKTFHRLMCFIEDSGWVINDIIMWLYGSGHPKGLNIGNHVPGFYDYHSKLKPAWDPVIWAMKPNKESYAKNAEKWGVSGLNVGACRFGEVGWKKQDASCPGRYKETKYFGVAGEGEFTQERYSLRTSELGRFPSNVLHDGSKESITAIDSFYQKGNKPSRLFYCPKPMPSEKGKYNDHPTVKPLELVRHLCKMVKMPGNTVILDIFAGSGTMALGAILEGCSYILIEKEKSYIEICKKRITDLLSNQKGVTNDCKRSH